MIAFLLTGSGLRVAAIIAVIVALIAAVTLIHHSGVVSEQNYQSRIETQNVQNADKTRAGIDALPSDDVDSRLHQYQR